MTNQQGAPEALRLADSYAKAHAMYCMEDLYGTSKSYTAELLKERHAARERLAAALVEAQQPAPSAAAATEVENLRKALQFYADKDHFTIADDGAWDTVSGEPQNYWCDEEGTATVEDGMIARLALAGHQIKFDADAAPQPSPTPQADSAPLAAPADIVVLEAALRAIHQAIDLIGEPDTERLRTVRRVLRGAVVVAEDSTAPQADSQPAPFVDQKSENLSDKAACASPVIDKPAPLLDRARIREIFMAHGFTVKEGQTDLKQYVYDAADALLRAARAPADSQPAPVLGTIAHVGTGKTTLTGAITSALRAASTEADSVTAPAGGAVAGPTRQQVSDRLSFLEGLVAEHTYTRIVDEVDAMLAPTPPTPSADSVLEDAARLDWLDQQCEAYGFQDIHEGNRWEISGAYANVREAIDAERAARKQGANHDNA